MASGTRAAGYLTRAWEQAWGRNPNASDSYRDSVRAVEAATSPIVLPNDANATLGRVIGTIRANAHLYVCRVDPDQTKGTGAS